MKYLALIAALLPSLASAGDDCHYSPAHPIATDWNLTSSAGTINFSATFAPRYPPLYTPPGASFNGRDDNGSWGIGFRIDDRWRLEVWPGDSLVVVDETTVPPSRGIAAPITIGDYTISFTLPWPPGTIVVKARYGGIENGEPQACSADHLPDATLTIPGGTPIASTSWGHLKARWAR